MACFVTTRILVVDILSHRIRPQQIAGEIFTVDIHSRLQQHSVSRQTRLSHRIRAQQAAGESSQQRAAAQC
jgi:RecA/RadA recombinase